MNLHHLSASSLRLFLNCPSAWEAKYGGATLEESGDAANWGKRIHTVLDQLVKEGFHLEDDSWKLLNTLYQDMLEKEFGPGPSRAWPGEDQIQEYRAMLKRWHDRQAWSGIEVVSTEQRAQFMIRTKYGEVPFVYIIDRVDAVNGKVEVVDYKTGKLRLTAEELKNDVQGLSYATAAWLAVPDQHRYWVTFDYLRDEPVGVAFTPDECRAFYDVLVAQAEKIIEMPSGDAPETINSNCRFCPKMTYCTAFNEIPNEVSALSFAGLHSQSAGDVASLRMKMHRVRAAADAALKQLDPYLIGLFKGDPELLQIPLTDTEALTLGSSGGRRWVDTSKVLEVEGPEVVAGYASMTIGDAESLIQAAEARGDLEGASRLRTAIRPGRTRQGLKTEPRLKHEI